MFALYTVEASGGPYPLPADHIRVGNVIIGDDNSTRYRIGTKVVSPADVFNGVHVCIGDLWYQVEGVDAGLGQFWGRPLRPAGSPFGEPSILPAILVSYGDEPRVVEFLKLE